MAGVLAAHLRPLRHGLEQLTARLERHRRERRRLGCPGAHSAPAAGHRDHPDPPPGPRGSAWCCSSARRPGDLPQHHPGLARHLAGRGAAGARRLRHGDASTTRSRCEMRVPRTLLGLLRRRRARLSGAILQGVTRNPLADPGIMGINAGAAAVVVAAITVLGRPRASTSTSGSRSRARSSRPCWCTPSPRSVARAPRRSSWPWPARPSPPGSTRYTSAIVMTNVDALERAAVLAGRVARPAATRRS